MWNDFLKKVSSRFSEIDYYNELIQNLKKQSNSKILVFYSEKDIYYLYFEGFIQYILNNTELQIHYITSDMSDPILIAKNPRIKPYYLNFMLANAMKSLDNAVIVMTTPDLDKYFLKRSKSSVNHVYVFHGMGSMHLQYNKGAFDAYDTIFCIGPYDYHEFKTWIIKYGLPIKELVKCGYPRIEKIYSDNIRRKNYIYPLKSKIRKRILIAPSWHDNNILEVCIQELIDCLKNTEFDVIIRPHPEFLKRKKKTIQKILSLISSIENISLELDFMHELSLLEADILITDWSAISFEYAFGTERPVLFINTPCKIFNVDYQELGLEPIEFSTRNKIGITINLNEIKNINLSLKKLLEDRDEYRDEIIRMRSTLIFNWQNSSQAGGEFLNKKCQMIKNAIE